MKKRKLGRSLKWRILNAVKKTALKEFNIAIYEHKGGYVIKCLPITFLCGRMRVKGKIKDPVMMIQGPKEFLDDIENHFYYDFRYDLFLEEVLQNLE